MSDWTQYSYGDQQQPGGGGGGYGGGGGGFYDSSYDFSGGQQAQQGTQDEDSKTAANFSQLAFSQLYLIFSLPERL